MSNNRSLINDSEIIRGGHLLEKGLPIPGLRGTYTVEDGWCAVITVDGMFREILPAGRHIVNQYGIFRDVKATAIDVRVQTLKVSTTGEFTIAQPVPVQINLDVSIEYKVSDPRRVATEVKTPLTMLYDRVLQAVRSIVAYATIDEIRTQGEGLAINTLQRLHSMQLQTTIGIEVYGVLVTSIKATDTAGDALASQTMSEFTKMRDWQLDTEMTSNSRVTWEWMLIHRPEVAQQLIVTYGSLAKEMIEQGALNLSSFLNTPANGGMVNGPASILSGLGLPGTGQSFPGNPPGFRPGVPSASPAWSASPEPPPALQLSAASSLAARMREELDYLRQQSELSIDHRSAADGSQLLRIIMRRTSGSPAEIYCTCPANYPQAAPVIEAEIDGQSFPIQSLALRTWRGQFLIEIMREIRQQIG